MDNKIWLLCVFSSCIGMSGYQLCKHTKNGNKREIIVNCCQMLICLVGWLITIVEVFGGI